MSDEAVDFGLGTLIGALSIYFWGRILGWPKLRFAGRPPYVLRGRYINAPAKRRFPVTGRRTLVPHPDLFRNGVV